MMKRVLIFVLALILVFSATACTGGSETGTTSPEGETPPARGNTLKWTDPFDMVLHETSFQFTKTDDENGVLEYADSYIYSDTRYIGFEENLGELRYTAIFTINTTYSALEDGTYAVRWHPYETPNISLRMEVSGKAKDAFVEMTLEEYEDMLAMQKLLRGETLTDLNEIRTTAFVADLKYVYITLAVDNAEMAVSSCKFEYSNGFYWNIHELKYNDDGKLICKYDYGGNYSITEYREDGTPEKQTEYWDSKWEKMKSVSVGSYDSLWLSWGEYNYYNLEGTLMGSSKNTYDESSVEIKYYDASGALIGKHIMDFNGDDKYITADGQEVNRTELIYRDIHDENGNIEQRTYYSTTDFSPTRTIVYDKNGNIVQTQEYYWHSDGLEITYYDAKERQICEENYDSAIELSSKYYTCYAENGQEIGDIYWQYRDGELDSIEYNNYNNESKRVYMESKYDENGNKTGVVYYYYNGTEEQEIDQATFESLEWVAALKLAAGME